MLSLVEAPCAFSAIFGYAILLVSVRFLESARVRLRGASKYVKTNTFEQGLILTTLTIRNAFFFNFLAPLWDARHVLKGVCTRSILKPLTHFWLLG